MKRSMRRHEAAKKKKQSLALWGHVKYADHLKVCSCAACGSPRKYEKGAAKLTRQELQAKAREE